MTTYGEKDWIIITEEEAGERIDKVLAGRFQEVQSRTYFQSLIEQNLVLVNGTPIKKRIKPHAGDEVEIQFVMTPEIDLNPEAIPLNILYEDHDILVINKSAGMVVHPAPGNWSGTFVNALLHHCKELKNEGLRPGIVHRLDKDTSGVLIAAKTTEAQQCLTCMFAKRRVDKRYLAICLGNPGEGEIDAPIGRHPVHRKRMAVRQEGKEAITRCKTTTCNGQISRVEIELLTGRTHQIRVHMKHKGTPILGDSTYGNADANAKYRVNRQMLHAEVLRLEHPITGKTMEFRAPIPEDMSQLCAYLSSE